MSDKLQIELVGADPLVVQARDVLEERYSLKASLSPVAAPSSDVCA